MNCWFLSKIKKQNPEIEHSRLQAAIWGSHENSSNHWVAQGLDQVSSSRSATSSLLGNFCRVHQACHWVCACSSGQCTEAHKLFLCHHPIEKSPLNFQWKQGEKTAWLHTCRRKPVNQQISDPFAVPMPWHTCPGWAWLPRSWHPAAVLTGARQETCWDTGAWAGRTSPLSGCPSTLAWNRGREENEL